MSNPEGDGLNFFDPARHYRPYFDCIQSNDVLGGRGINIAQHPGNIKFRALVAIFTDKGYCKDCTPQEKKAIAEQIVEFCGGRYLMKEGQVWRVANTKDFIKKACQALRDCNRGDRSGYGRGVKVPDEVKKIEKEIFEKNMSVKDLAKIYMRKSQTDSCKENREALRYARVINHPTQDYSPKQVNPFIGIQRVLPQPFYPPMPSEYSNPPPHQSVFYGNVQDAHPNHLSSPPPSIPKLHHQHFASSEQCNVNDINTATIDNHLEGVDVQGELDLNVFDNQTQMHPSTLINDQKPTSTSNLANSEFMNKFETIDQFMDGLY
jgi:hypothetical protein